MPGGSFPRDWWTARQRWPLTAPIALIAMATHSVYRHDCSFCIAGGVAAKMGAAASRADKGPLWLARVGLRGVVGRSLFFS